MYEKVITFHEKVKSYSSKKKYEYCEMLLHFLRNFSNSS